MLWAGEQLPACFRDNAVVCRSTEWGPDLCTPTWVPWMKGAHWSGSYIGVPWLLCLIFLVLLSHLGEPLSACQGSVPCVLQGSCTILAVAALLEVLAFLLVSCLSPEWECELHTLWLSETSWNPCVHTATGQIVRLSAEEAWVEPGVGQGAADEKPH